MSIKLTRRVAAELLGSGERAVRILPSALEEAKKAITRDDVRRLIKDGSVYKAKRAEHKTKKEKRKKGTGKKKGTAKARQGRQWERRIRAQRRLLQRLKAMGKIDTKTFNKYYLLAKGNIFADKRSLLLHLSDEGVKVSDEELKQIDEYVRGLYR